MMKTIKCSNYLILFLLSLFILISSDPTPFNLDEVVKGSLQDKTYMYYKLKLPILDKNDKKLLLFEARRNEEQDFLDNIFSDPNIYISTKQVYPGPTENTWSSSRFGDEIISINQNFVVSEAIFYVAIYCEFKCNYILDAKLYDNYMMKDDKVYTINMIEDDVVKLTFKTRENFESLKINCVSFKMKPFRVYLSIKDPSSANNLPSYPLFINGYYFLIKKGDENYKTEQEYEVLIENKKYKQEVLFWIYYDNEDIELSELSPLFGSAPANEGNCYLFKIDKQYQNKNIIISTTLFNGNGNLKIGGWEKVKDMKVKKEEKYNYPIISDKSILLSENDFKTFDNSTKEKNKDLHFCFIASEETSYLIKIYYQEHAEQAQKLNYLLPGIGSDDMLPGNTVTQYIMLYFEQHKDIKISLKVKSGSPKLYSYYTYEDNPYINKTKLDGMIKDSTIIKGESISYRNYEITLLSFENDCILQPNKGDKECKIYAVIECETEKDCLYDLFFDHKGDIITMKPKVLYSNVITEKEYDLYQIRINDEYTKNFAVILTQITGNVKLKFNKYVSESGEVSFENTEMFNKDYMPNAIEIKAKDFPSNSIKGSFEIEVEGFSFSSYDIYYYTFDDDNNNKLDHKTIKMSLTKGNIIQDYIKYNHYIQVYSYDNSNIGQGKSDLYIYLDSPYYGQYQVFVFKDLNDFSYENKKIKGFLWQTKYYNYIHIEKNDPNYIVGNLYIMVFTNRFEDTLYRKENPSESPFSLAITDETTPLNLIEGVEFRHVLTKKRPAQTFYYNHRNKEEEFAINVNVPYSKVKIGIKMGEKDYMYEKIITGNYFLNIDLNEISEYCPAKFCNMLITTEVATNDYDNDIEISILCKSSKNSIVYLNKNGLIEQRTIFNNEKQFFVVDVTPVEGYSLKINTIFSYGKGILYAKKAEKNELIKASIFPDETNYEYKSNINDNIEEISLLSIPYNEIKDHLPCKILVTVKANFYYLARSQGEYSISVSNMVDDIFPNKNYRLFGVKSEIKYFHFRIKGQKKRISISMTDKEVDGFMYLNYDNMNKEMEEFQWKSEGNYNEYIDISIDDPFFVSRKIKSLEGDYYLAVRILKDSYYNLFISDSDVKITTITEDFPGTCRCEKEGDFCYFRYENINSPDIVDVIDQEMIFYFDFTYGSAEIYANLFPHGNNDIIIKSLENKYFNDFKSLYSNDYIKIRLSPRLKNKKYTLDSVLILNTKCKTKALFDFNVRSLLKTEDLIKYYDGIKYLNMDKDNVFYLIGNARPVKFILYSTTNLPLVYEAKAIEGSANVHCYINNEEIVEDEKNPDIVKGYKHISEFSVVKGDSGAHFDSISEKNSYRQNLYFEVTARINCLFYIHLHYSEKPTFIPMSKQIQDKFINGKLYAYIEMLQEYEEVIFTIDKMNVNSEYSVYAKTSIVNSLNFEMSFSYSSPSENNYDVKATTNSFYPSLSIKIKNVDKDQFVSGKKVITVFYIISNDYNSYNDKLNMIAYPNVDHYELIYPKPNKYIYSSITDKNVDKTVFAFKKEDKDNNLLVVEISSCQGNFISQLSNNIKFRTNNKIETYSLNGKGKEIIFAQMESNVEYYLSVMGTKEDEMIFDEDVNTNRDIDFLLYYYFTNIEEYNKENPDSFDSKFNYKIKSKGNIVIKLPDLENMNSNTKIKLDDLNISVIISKDAQEFEYMGSICYLSRQYDKIKSEKLYKNYTIKVNKNKKEIEINNLEAKTNYYLNILITNKKTGQIFALDPLQIIPYRRITVVAKKFLTTLLSIFIVILLFVMFYVYRKYRITKAIVNYEKNDIKNMGTIPKSITELKKIQEEKNKKAKEKYNSLTEDSGQI